jgi:hypothetical protein
VLNPLIPNEMVSNTPVRFNAMKALQPTGVRSPRSLSQVIACTAGGLGHLPRAARAA